MPATVARASARRLPRRRAVAVAVAIAVLAVVVDQVTKALALAHLSPGQPATVIDGWLWLTLLRNPGAAFSLGESATGAFAVLALLATVAIIVIILPRLRMARWAVVVGLFLAGIVGNLIDRIIREPAVLRGHVIDFLQIPHWPVFNVADMCITAGAVLMIVLTLFTRAGLDGIERPR